MTTQPNGPNGKTHPKRALHIGGASGGFTDRVSAIARLASLPGVDAIVGDWLSENVITGYGAAKQARNANEENLGRALTYQEKKGSPCFASTFLQCFEYAVERLKGAHGNEGCDGQGKKLVVNAGAKRYGTSRNGGKGHMQ